MRKSIRPQSGAATKKLLMKTGSALTVISLGTTRTDVSGEYACGRNVMAHEPILSVVDYAAWEKGYMPPGEHILIDKLSYRGAKVVMSFAVGKTEQVWVVLEGAPKLSRAKRAVLLKVMRLWFEADDEAETVRPHRFTILNDGPDRFVLVDTESDAPAPVYTTAAEAEAALTKALAEIEI